MILSHVEKLLETLVINRISSFYNIDKQEMSNKPHFAGLMKAKSFSLRIELHNPVTFFGLNVQLYAKMLTPRYSENIENLICNNFLILKEIYLNLLSL